MYIVIKNVETFLYVLHYNYSALDNVLVITYQNVNSCSGMHSNISFLTNVNKSLPLTDENNL